MVEMFTVPMGRTGTIEEIASLVSEWVSLSSVFHKP
jgi:hypothetical protein